MKLMSSDHRAEDFVSLPLSPAQLTSLSPGSHPNSDAPDGAVGGHRESRPMSFTDCWDTVKSEVAVDVGEPDVGSWILDFLAG